MPTKNLFQKIRYITYTIIILGFIIFYYLIVNPILYYVSKPSNTTQANETNLRNHVLFLTTTKKERNYKELDTLNMVGDYIFKNFKDAGCDDVYFQKFMASGNEYKNVVCHFNGKKSQKIVVGAHYDVDSDNVFNTSDSINNYYFAGADDNASGVAGILELSNMIGKNKNNLNHSIELVAYNLEEMPFFDSNDMGSYIHAKSLFDNKEDIAYMISLEMIGYFSDEKIQKYPVRFLSRFYPSKGNYIAIIGKIFDFDIKNIKINMTKNSDIPIVSLSAPSMINGIDFSDHKNYWNFGYKAYMITDTSFFRNKYYHTSEDTIEKLDFKKMKQVVNGVYGIITNG